MQLRSYRQRSPRIPDDHGRGFRRLFAVPTGLRHAIGTVMASGRRAAS